MSGIVGIHYLDERPVDRENLTKMVDILAHRGPDGADIWVDECVGFGHRMLWTTPESLIEKLPLVNQRGDLVITADARIDNRDELIAALQINNRHADTIADSELILAAYEKWGEDCPENLLGDFAFAIWDKRKQKLFCARDSIGAKPFYYYYSGRFFAFASEIKGLVCLSEVPCQLNEVKIADHLAHFCEDRTSTFYKDIFILPPASSLTLDNRGIRFQSYWSLNPSYELRLPSDMEYTEAFSEIFTDAVRCRLRSAFPVGSTLSGGVDSSSISCTARDLLLRAGKDHLHTFSAIFPSLPEKDLKLIDERRYVAAVVGMGGLNPHYIHADELSPLTDIDRMQWHEYEPLQAPNLYMHWAIYGAAQKQGVRVILDGVDGDTTVSHGMEYLPELIRTVKPQRLLTEVSALAQRFPHISRRKILWQFGIKSLLPNFAIEFRQSFRRGFKATETNSTILNSTFAKRIDMEQRIQAFAKLNSPVRNARDAHRQSLNSPLIPQILELADRATTAFSLEARYPFCDRRLIEFCLSLPSEQKLNRGWTRAILHRAMVGILPPEVHSRTIKANLSPNFRRQLLANERQVLEEVVLDKSQVIEPYVDIQALQTAYSNYLAAPMQSMPDALKLYSAVSLSHWLQKSNFTR